MISKLIGAFAGSKLANGARGIGGTKGAILGMGAATLAKRASLPVLIAATAGGYFLKKRMDREDAEKPANSSSRVDTQRFPPEAEPVGN